MAMFTVKEISLRSLRLLRFASGHKIPDFLSSLDGISSFHWFVDLAEYTQFLGFNEGDKGFEALQAPL